MQYNLIPTLRKDKENAKGICPIHIFIYSGSELIAKRSTGQKTHIDNWNDEERKVRKSDSQATLKNANIKKSVSELEAKILTGNLTGDEGETLKGIIKKEKFKEIDFFEFAETQRTEKKLGDETKRNRLLYAEKFADFLKTKGALKIKLTEIDYRILQQYENYLRTERNNAPNTVWGAFKFINCIVNDAIRIGYLKESPFHSKLNPKGYKRPVYKQTPRTYLTAAELAKIEAYAEESTGEESVVAKQFLFMCYTGLSFADASRFRVDVHIIDGERIIINRKKTENATNIFINDAIKSLLPFIQENPITFSQPYFNRVLKIIAGVCKIKKRITSHVGRHSFGKKLVDLGVTKDVAKRLLAHGSINSTNIYYHVDSANLDEAMKKFNKAI